MGLNDTYVRFFVFMEHRGEIIEQAIRQSGIPISQIAKKLNKSRQWIYVMFGNPNTSLETVLEIGKIIHHDFSNEIKSLNKVFSNTEDKNEHQIKDINYWKEKYFRLLEEHYELLKKVQ